MGGKFTSTYHSDTGRKIAIKPESGQALKVYTAANYLRSNSGKKPEEEL